VGATQPVGMFLDEITNTPLPRLPQYLAESRGLGLGDDGFLRWTIQPTAEQDKKMDDVINAAYRSIRSRLQTCRALLDRVTAALEEKQELSGNELRRLAKSIGAAAAPA
jgi:hypothetical protein